MRTTALLSLVLGGLLAPVASACSNWNDRRVRPARLGQNVRKELSAKQGSSIHSQFGSSAGWPQFLLDSRGTRDAVLFRCVGFDGGSIVASVVWGSAASLSGLCRSERADPQSLAQHGVGPVGDGKRLDMALRLRGGAGKQVYAVVKGFTLGLHTDWASCKAATQGFKGALFKGFEDKAAAERWIREHEHGAGARAGLEKQAIAAQAEERRRQAEAEQQAARAAHAEWLQRDRQQKEEEAREAQRKAARRDKARARQLEEHLQAARDYCIDTAFREELQPTLRLIVGEASEAVAARRAAEERRSRAAAEAEQARQAQALHEAAVRQAALREAAVRRLCHDVAAGAVQSVLARHRKRPREERSEHGKVLRRKSKQAAKRRKRLAARAVEAEAEAEETASEAEADNDQLQSDGQTWRLRAKAEKALQRSTLSRLKRERDTAFKRGRQAERSEAKQGKAAKRKRSKKEARAVAGAAKRDRDQKRQKRSAPTEPQHTAAKKQKQRVAAAHAVDSGGGEGRRRQRQWQWQGQRQGEGWRQGGGQGQGGR